MLLFAVTGVMRAQSLTVHDGTGTNSYVPAYGFYADAYLKCEMVYPAEELSEMSDGMINAITFYATSPAAEAWTGTWQVFVTEVADATISAYVGPGTVVYEGALDATQSTMTITFDAPYTYAGGNLLVGVYQTATGNYKSVTWAGETVTGASVQGYSYSGLSSISATQRNFLPKTTFDYVPGGGGALATDPDRLDLGYRPNGAWMAPYKFNIVNNGGALSVNAIDLSGSYYSYNAELPATVYAGNPLEVELTTGEAEEGNVHSTLTVLYGENRDAIQFDVNATAYNPYAGDVYELAIEVPMMEPRTPVEYDLPTDIKKNYDLPYETSDADAVYKVNFSDDVLLYAGAEMGGVTVYPEDFFGEGGPMADNYYEYDGPTINPGPMSMWFAYDYTGSNTFFGTSAGGGMIFGYRITSEMLQELGLGNCAITTVEAAAREGSYYDLIILKGGDTPDINNMVYYQEFDAYTPYYFFDVNLDEAQFLGDDENIWVMFYSDSPYAAYCGKQPVDVNNGKIWYTTNMTSWYSNTTYTPEIYTRFLELPTGREVTVNLADMSIRESKPAEGQLAEANGDVNGVSKAQIAQAHRGNRDAETIIDEGFEGGSMPDGWASEGNGNWLVGSGDYSTSTGSATGTYNAMCKHSTTGNVTYLVTPAMDLSNATSATLSCNYINRSWAGDTDGFGIYYRVNGGAWNELFATSAAHSSWTASGDIELTGLAANYQIGFKHSDSYGYGVGLDDVLITAEISGTPTPEPPTPNEPFVPEFEAQIDGMYVPAGTYYVVATGERLNMAIDEVPVPEQAIVYAPYDGETNLTTPYLAEWELGDYTYEMQVLVGTQYPPQTALIDWTDYLVESAFILDLQPNQSYFMQVNERNATGTTMGEIVAFTTPIDGVEGLAVEEEELYPGDAANFSWVANRSLQGYNLYCNGVKVNETPIVGNTYSVEGLEYNMDGYDFTITAVYDAGESAPSAESVTVYMTGNGTVSGAVYELDVEHPIPFATVEFVGVDEYGEPQYFTMTAGEDGTFTGEMLAGEYTAYVATEGYDPTDGVAVPVNYNEETGEVNLITHEFYYPVGQVTATEEEDDVLVEWSWDPAEFIVDFESGDFSQAEFTLPAQYPWTVTTTNPYEGTYCMKSTCEGQASATSSIEVTVEVPFEEAKMSFYVRTSSETNYDKFHFYIDGVEQGSALSGQNPYALKEYNVSGGTHTYRWEYTKDSSVNSNDDCIYVDYITLYRKDEPLPPIPGATTYDFDNGAQGWTSIDANNDGYGWVLGSEIGGVYLVSGASLSGSGHNESTDLMCSGSYSNATSSAITPDNYLVAPTAISAENGAAISFWACAQDASYAAEHFGVFVSTTTATASAFTMVQEWTMTAKGPQGSTADNAQDIRGTRAQGSWYQYQVDLSSYAGQDIWVAIRHFNCNDQFILNVDDITLADGSAKAMPRNNREFMSFNVYRRNNIVNEEPTLLAEGVDGETFEYVDAEWPSLPYGEWQWGVAATYDGYATPQDRETTTFGFEGGLEGWTGIVVNSDGGEWIHSDDNLGGYDYTELAHSGTGFAMCYSYVDYVGAYNTDAYMVSPEKYTLDANSSITFWADNANDDYPEDFSVCVSTADVPTASSFVQVWNGGAKGSVSEKAAVRHDNNRYQNWRSHTVSLASYAGQSVWIAFHDVNYDEYEIWIDDVTITHAGGGPTPPPTPGPVGAGISEIIWSNVIEKDMEATLTFEVFLNNNQPSDGALVSVIGENHEYTQAVVDGLAEIVVRKGDTYDIAVTMDGYTTWHPSGNPILVEDDNDYQVMLNEIIVPVEGLYVSPTGWAMWEGGAAPGGNTPGGGGGGSLSTFSVDFENGMPEGWTTIDANNDGFNWVLGSQIGGVYLVSGASLAGSGHNSSNDLICSGSYSNATSSAITPDNYLVSPQVTLGNGSTFSFWACGQDASYVAEHFGVFVSDNGTSDWTMVQEWTMTAKEGGNVMSIGRNGQMRAQGSWYQKTVDLSSFAGQKYIAIRHFNCNDMFILDVDDIELTAGTKGDRAPVAFKVMLDGVYEGETQYSFFQHNVDGLEIGSTHTTSVAPLYASGMGDWMTYDWTLKDCSEFAGPTEFTGAQNGTDVELSWTLPGGTTPVTPPSGPTTYDFDDGTFQGWTTLDANNDGYNWVLGSQIGGIYLVSGASLSGSGHNSSTDLVCSGSYSNATSSAITPDNYLISPEKAVCSNISFYACGQDASYVAEHFGVFVSTGDATASDFTMVQEWTMTAKDQGAMSIGRGGEIRAQGSWHQYNVDLSAYAGQPIWVAIRHFNCNDMFILDVDDITLNGTKTAPSRDMWDLEFSFNGTSGYQYGVASDGEYIYTSSWSASSTSMFYKYDLQGNFIEEFNITGCGQIRDLTYDGQYFYGVANSTTIYCVDLANHALVGTTNSAYGAAMRCITYDPERDGFWVVGNWSGNLTLLDRTGAVVQSAGAPTSASGIAYYKDTNDIEHVLYLKNESGNGEVYEYNITTNTMVTTPIYNCVNTTGGAATWTGSSGGCHVGAYNGKTCLFADAQQSPQLINIYELDAAGPGPGPGPQPVEGLVGAVLYRNGEIVDIFDDQTTSYVDHNAAAGENEYCLRVIYGGAPDTTLWAMSCLEDCQTIDYECKPVTNLQGTYFIDETLHVTLTWENTFHYDGVYYEVYYDNTLAGTTEEMTYTVDFDQREDYEFGVVAVYPNCESEMVYTTITVTGFEEYTNNVNIYPNPTNSNVTIEAAGMSHITVVSAIGQVVYDADVEADMIQLNLGQFKAGVYTVRINAANGITVKRVSVVK